MGRKTKEQISIERLEEVLNGMSTYRVAKDTGLSETEVKRIRTEGKASKDSLKALGIKLSISPRYLTGETDNRNETYQDYIQHMLDYESFSKYADEQEQMKLLVLRYLSSKTYRVPGTTKLKSIDFESFSWEQADELLQQIQKTAWIYAVENDLFGETEGE